MKLPGLPAFLAEGLGLCPWAHCLPHTQIHVPIFTAHAQRSTPTDTRLMYPFRGRLVLSAGILERRPAQRSTQTHARYTTRVSSHPPLLDRHSTDSHPLGDGRLRNTPSHTARHAWPRPRGGHILETVSDISEVHVHMRARTNPHRLVTHTC